MPILPMWHAIYSLSYHLLLALRQALQLGEMLSAGASQKREARPFVKKSLEGSLLEPTLGY
jgi:hypothetical protein